jgi:hypothetical protein
MTCWLVLIVGKSVETMKNLSNFKFMKRWIQEKYINFKFVGSVTFSRNLPVLFRGGTVFPVPCPRRRRPRPCRNFPDSGFSGKVCGRLRLPARDLLGHLEPALPLSSVRSFIGPGTGSTKIRALAVLDFLNFWRCRIWFLISNWLFGTFY